MSEYQIIESVLIKANPGYGSSYVIPNDVLEIADGNESENAFASFGSISFSISFAENAQITRIGSYSFYNRNGLTSIDFSNANSLKSIGDRAFGYCIALREVNFPASLESLDYYGSFTSCSNLAVVTFPDDSKVTYISTGSFWGSALTTFRVPASCTSIVGETFACTNIQSFSVQEGSTAYKEYDGSVFSYDLSSLILHRKSGELSLPPQTTGITGISLSYLKGDIEIRKNISKINDLAFHTFMGKRITFLCPIHTISGRMFDFCTKLIEVKFYNEVSSISANAFQYCVSLKRVVLIYPVNAIVKEAFPDINKICFYGAVDSIRELIQDASIKKCNVYFNTCHIGRRRVNSITILICIFLNS